MTPRAVTWSRGLLTLIALAAPTLFCASCARSDAQTSASQAPVAAARCTAAVVATDIGKSCPTASVTFQITVTGCPRSSGSFDYAYMRVSETRKIQASGSSNWRNGKGRWQMAETVPLSCDEEILDVQPTVSRCTCEP